MTWIDANTKPEKDTPVIALGVNNNNKIKRVRAKWIPEFYQESDGDDFHGDLDYSEEKDEFYWPEGWYEWNEFDDTHWLVDVKVLYWIPLPEPTKEMMEQIKNYQL